MVSNRSRGRRNVLTVLLTLLGLAVGESVILGTVYLCRAAVSLTPLETPGLQTVVVWLAASVIVALVNGAVFGLPLLRGAAQQTATPQSSPTDTRSVLSIALLRTGRTSAYVGASLIGGALPVAWWYGRKGSRHAWPLTIGAAAILGFSSTAIWLGLLSPTLRWYVVVTALGVGVAASGAYLAQLQTWNLLARLYNGLFALKPHRDLVQTVAGTIGPGDLVLDAGCGTGWLGYFARRSGPASIIGVDISPVMAAAAHRRGVHAMTCAASLTNLPFADGTFDRAVSVNVLYAVNQPEAALRELARVLKPGGQLVLANPISSALLPLLTGHWRDGTWRDHLRLLANVPRLLAWVLTLLVKRPKFEFLPEAELRRVITQSGFSIQSVVPTYAGIDVLVTATTNK